MSNTLTKELYEKWKQLQDELAHALDNRDENGVTQVNAKIQEFATANAIRLTEPVIRSDTIPPGPVPVDTNCEAYKSGFKHGQDDLKIKDAAKRYINQPNKGFDHHSANFNAGYNKGFGVVIPQPPVPIPPTPIPIPPSPSPTPSPPAPAGTGLDQFGQKMIHPSKPGGQVVTTHATRYFTRNYRSGKASEPTVEMDITGINFANQECTAIVTMTGMSHPDTLDWKLRGGAHSSDTPKTGTCYDVEVMTDGSASKTLEVESPHPDNHAAHQPQLFKPGDLSKARFGWKGVTLDTPDGKGVLIESYINLTPDDQNGWKKYISVVDTGQLYKGTSPILKPYGTIAKIRIDGIIGKPTFDKVSCREITN